jgi:hypothetical protein
MFEIVAASSLAALGVVVARAVTSNISFVNPPSPSVSLAHASNARARVVVSSSASLAKRKPNPSSGAFSHRVAARAVVVPLVPQIPPSDA